MKLPNFKRLYEQDFSENYKDLIRQLAISFNSGFESLYDIVQGKLTLQDNIACSIKEITVKVGSDGIPISMDGISASRITFTLDNSNATLAGCQVIKATCNEKTTTYPTGGIFITYSQTNKGIEVKHIAGLPANVEYVLKIVAYYQ